MKKESKRKGSTRNKKTKINGAGRPSHPVAKEKLLKVALTLFSKKGYSAVSIREIAKKANVNTANISYHFGSKFGLYREIFQRILSSRQNELNHLEMRHKNTPKEKAICRIRMISELIAKEPEFVNLLFRVLLTESDKKIRNVVTREFLPPLCQNIFEILSNAKVSPKYDFLDAETLASFVIAVKAFWFLYAESFAYACPKVTKGNEIVEHSNEALKKLFEAVLLDD